MPDKLDFHCADCGADRGGVIDLAEKPVVLRCFGCAKKHEPRKVENHVRNENQRTR